MYSFESVTDLLFLNIKLRLEQIETANTFTSQ